MRIFPPLPCRKWLGPYSFASPLDSYITLVLFDADVLSPPSETVGTILRLREFLRVFIRLRLLTIVHSPIWFRPVADSPDTLIMASLDSLLSTVTKPPSAHINPSTHDPETIDFNESAYTATNPFAGNSLRANDLRGSFGPSHPTVSSRTGHQSVMTDVDFRRNDRRRYDRNQPGLAPDDREGIEMQQPQRHGEMAYTNKSVDEDTQRLLSRNQDGQRGPSRRTLACGCYNGGVVSACGSLPAAQRSNLPWNHAQRGHGRPTYCRPWAYVCENGALRCMLPVGPHENRRCAHWHCGCDKQGITYRCCC